MSHITVKTHHYFIQFITYGGLPGMINMKSNAKQHCDLYLSEAL